MQVNVEAVSDALDGLLIEKSLNSQTPRQRQNSAIIQKRQQQPPQPVARGPRSFEGRKATRASQNTQNSNSTSKKDHIDTSPRKLSKPIETTINRSEEEVAAESPPTTTNELADSLQTPTFKNSQLSHSPPFQASGKSERPSAYGSDGFATIQSLFKRIDKADVIAVKPIEASGLGIGSVLVTPRNAAKQVEKAQLSSKSWVTNTTLSSYASAVLEIENYKQVKREQTQISTSEDNSNILSVHNYSVTHRDVAIVVYLDGSEQPPHQSNDRGKRVSFVNLTFSITVETSNSRRRGFTAFCVQTVVAGRLTSLIIPGTKLKQFIRLTIKPHEENSASKLVCARTLCVLWSDTWTAEVTEQTECPSSLEEEVEEALRAYNKQNEEPHFFGDTKDIANNAKHTCSIPSKNEVSPKWEQQVLNDNDASNIVSPERRDVSSVASFVKNIALASMNDSNAAESEREVETDSHGHKWEYNWLSDQLELRLPKDAQPLQAFQQEKNGSGGNADDLAAVSTVSEYIAVLQAWNLVESWTIEDAVKFCMAQTTSFSASTISATDFFSEAVAVHFTQLFKVHFLVTDSLSVDDEGDKACTPKAATSPPLQLLSTIANQALALGYASELLFKNEVSGSFGCILRPDISSLQHVEEHCKLLFVVPAGRRSGHSTNATEMLVFLLKTALGVFYKSQVCSQSPTKQSSQQAVLHSVGFRQAPLPSGVLRVLIDGTESFEKLIPILTEWSDVAGPIRYYGDASQVMLRVLLTPVQFIEKHNIPISQLSENSCIHEAQWSRLHIKLLGLWESKSSTMHATEMKTMALELQAVDSVTYAWESVTRERASLRLILTDNHLLESVPAVDGLLLPSCVADLVQKFSTLHSNFGFSMPPVVTLSEAPWTELLTVAKKLGDVGNGASNSTVRDSVAAFTTLHRRVTVSFAFHILSTAFKRGWERVAVSVPLSCARFISLAATLREVNSSTLRRAAMEDFVSTTNFSLLDEDAFMDTLLQWSYPFPSVVVLHCTTVFHSTACVSPAREASTPLIGPLRHNSRGGVISLFSRETLCKFACIPSLEDALF